MTDEREDALPSGFFANTQEEIVRRNCEEAVKSGNSLLFFQALKHALAAALNRAVDDAEATGASGDEAMRAGFAADKSVHLPAELHDFLQSAMWRLCELEAGRDFREYPADHPHADAKFGSPEYRAYLDERRAYRDRSKHDGERLAPDAAAKLVPHALWITRPGFNAFRLSEKRNLAAIAVQEEADARARGASALQARLEAMERLGYGDERSFRRMKSGKPRGRGKPGG